MALKQVSPDADLDTAVYEIEDGGQISIDLPDLLAARNCVHTLFSRNPEGVMAIENRAKNFTQPPSSNLNYCKI